MKQKRNTIERTKGEGEGEITLAKYLSMRFKIIVNLKEIPAFQNKLDLITYREKQKRLRVNPVTLKQRAHEGLVPCKNTEDQNERL